MADHPVDRSASWSLAFRLADRAVRAALTDVQLHQVWVASGNARDSHSAEAAAAHWANWNVPMTGVPPVGSRAEVFVEATIKMVVQHASFANKFLDELETLERASDALRDVHRSRDFATKALRR